MNLKIEGALDQLDVKIVRELQANARTTYSEIGRRVGLSSPAVTERVRRMEEAGIICGYHADIATDKIGFPIQSFLFMTSQSKNDQAVYSFAEEAKEIIECHRISGSECFVFRVVATSVPHLDELVEKLNVYGETKTLIVLGSPVKKKYVHL